MRASRFNEHKLVLQDLVKTPEGENLFSATTKSEIANLPALDFYLPVKTHRQTWKPTADVYVAVTFDPDAPAITAYGTNGETLTLRKDQGVPPVPLIILHPAEPKSTRDVTVVASVGEVIESPTESPAANSSVSLSPSSASSTMLIDDGGGGGGGGGSYSAPPPGGTYINYFNIQEGDGWFGQSEMEFHSVALAGHWQFVQGTNGDNWFLIADYKCPLGSYKQGGVEEDQGYEGLFLLGPTPHSGSFLTCNGYPATYSIHMIENDGGILGGDDDYGWRIYSAGGYPTGATYNTVYSYYGNTFPFHSWDPRFNRVAYLRITIY